MPTTAWKSKNLTSALLAVGGILVSYLCFRVFQPFLSPTIWAITLALLLHPVYGPAARVFRNRSLAAIVLCLASLVILVLPCFYLISSLQKQVIDVYETLEATLLDPSGQTADPALRRAWEWSVATAARAGYELPSALSDLLQRVGSRVIAATPGVIGGVAALLFDFVMTFLTLFFFLRDGDRLVHWLQGLIPLNPEQTRGLFTKIGEVIRATVFGGLAVAVGQGVIGGGFFYAVGLPTPLLWGVIMGLLSLLPPLGAWLVWAPAGAILLSQGQILRAVILFAGGAFGVSMIDNILRPVIIGKQAQLPTLLIFLSLAGGLQVFGPVGLIAGPVLVALLIGILEFIRERLQAAER